MDEVAEVKQRLEVAEVVGGYLPLKQAGRNLKASCPFHNEKTASFMVSPEKGIWHCFGCGQGGDIFKFVMMMEGLEFREALELLARRAGVELKNRGGGGNTKLKARLYAAMALAERYYQATLAKNAKALRYLINDRHLTKETITAFGIGYAPDTWEALSKFLTGRGFTNDELTKAGLVGQRRGDGGVFDLFRGRITFPIRDTSGRALGFSGRVLPGADGDGPKYYNSPQTPLYDKSRTLFGIDQAREAIRSADQAILVEGNLDVVSSHQVGVKNVVAASGTALTSDQLRLVGKFSKNVALAFDQDGAGIKATERAIELAQLQGLMLTVVALEDQKDPDELIQQDPKTWKAAAAKPIYVIDYLFGRLAETHDLSTAVGKRSYSDRLAGTIRRLGDPVEREHYTKLLADKLGTSIESIEAKLKEPTTVTEPVAAKVTVKVQDPANLLESQVLAINLTHPQVRLSLSDLESKDFVQPEHQEIFETLRQLGAEADTAAVIKALPKLADYVKILELTGEQQYADLAPADCSLEAFTLVRNLRIGSNKRQRQAITIALRQAEKTGEADLVHRLTGEFQALTAEDL